LLFALVFYCLHPASAAIQPYTVDSVTLHLWHLDETSTPCMDAAPGGTNLTYLINGATLGNVSFSNSAVSFTNSISFGTLTTPGAVIFPSGSGNVGNAIPFTYAGADGAFTYEALVHVEFDPTNNYVNSGRSATFQIMDCDADNSGGTRVFQFRLDPVGLGAPGISRDTNVVGIEFVNGTTTIASAPIPTNGPDAIVSNAWYHVAVTYNGVANTTSNLLFYWTLLDPARTNADCIYGTNMTSDLPGINNSTTIFSLGNSARNPSGGTGADVMNFMGKIDEVRISSVARAATAMLFASTNVLILSQPSPTNQIVGVGQSFSIAVSAAGLSPNYQWRKNGTAISAATNSTYTDASAQLSDAGNYDVIITNNFSSVTSSIASVTVTTLSISTQITLTPVFDGTNAASSSYAYAGSSGINSGNMGLVTLNNQQFLAYYGQHQTNPSYAYNGTIWIARRTVGTNVWQIFRTTFVPDTITDGHDFVSFGIDGSNYMHLSWGMHNATPLHYARSLNPVTGTNTIAFTADLGTLTGVISIETEVTYPQFFNLPNGDLLYLYRVGGPGGGSGGGDTYLDRWSLAAQIWTNVNGNAPFIKGYWSSATNYNAYPNRSCVDAAGNFYMAWCWRETPAYESNHDLNYGMSTNGGVTWRCYNGTKYDLPICETNNGGSDPNEFSIPIVSIPQNYSLINQAGMCLDASNKPVIATWWAPGSGAHNYRRQYMVVFPDTNGVWQTRRVSNRTNDPAGTMELDAAVGDLGRPAVVCDKQNRIIVLYRDNFGSNGLTVACSLPHAVDPARTNWTTFDLATDNLGGYESAIDLARWQRDNVLDIVYHPNDGEGYADPGNTASPIGVLEWDEAAYFNNAPTLQMNLTNQNQDAALTWNTQPGWGYQVQSGTNLVNWNVITTLNAIPATLSGEGGFLPLQFVQTNGAAGPLRFWRLQAKEGGF
jgi:hypothetical protein